MTGKRRTRLTIGGSLLTAAAAMAPHAQALSVSAPVNVPVQTPVHVSPPVALPQPIPQLIGQAPVRHPSVGTPTLHSAPVHVGAPAVRPLSGTPLYHSVGGYRGAAATSRAGASGGGGASGSAGAAAPRGSRQASAQHRANATRKLRRMVLRFRGCLTSLPSRERRYLSLRAGLGLDSPMSRSAAAGRVGVPARRAGAFERRALASLGKAHSASGCGTSGQPSTGPGATTQRPGVGTPFAGSTSSTALLARQPASAAGSPGRQQVLAAHASSQSHSSNGSNGSNGSSGSSAGGSAGPPAAHSRPVGTVPTPDETGVNGLVWVIAAMAALAALAGSYLVRRRFGPRVLGARPGGPDAADAAVAAAVALPEAPPPAMPAAADRVNGISRDEAVAVVTRAYEALSAGDVGSATELVHPEVAWPEMTGGVLRGRDAFADYWNQRLELASVDIEPVSFLPDDDQLLVEVHEVVSSRSGQGTIGEYRALRRFKFRDGLISEMHRGRG